MDYCDRGIQETKHKRHGSSRRGGTPDRRYSSSSDEGTKISGNRDCRNRVRNLGQQGMASTGTEGWRAYDGGNGQIVQALPGRNPSSGSRVLSDTLNSSMQQRLYSYFSGSEDEEENGYAPHRLQNKWPRRSPSPVDVSSPSWVRSPSDLSCESETEQRPPSPRFDRRVDGTRFGENIYSRINSDAATLPVSMILAPSCTSNGLSPAIPPRHLPSNAKRPVTSASMRTQTIERQRKHQQQRGIPYSQDDAYNYREPENIPRHVIADRRSPSPNRMAPAFPRTVPFSDTTQRQRSNVSVSDANAFNAQRQIASIVPTRTSTSECTNPLVCSPGEGTVPQWIRQEQEKTTSDFTATALPERPNPMTHPPPNTHPPNTTAYPVIQSEFRNYSQFNQATQQVKKHLRLHCTWKCIALLFIILTVVLVFFILYLIGAAVSVLSGVVVLPFGKVFEERILPRSFSRSQFYLPNASFVKLNLTLPSSAIFAVYGSRNVPPSHVRYDFFQVFDGKKLSGAHQGQTHRSKRSLMDLVNSAFIQYMEMGVWYTFIYNDGESPQTVTFVATLHDQPAMSACPRNCHSRGDCVDGQCQCFSGYTGWDCKQSTCPMLCQGNGIYNGGICECYEGWKGRECELPSTQCEDPTCGNGNGKCVGGVCVCSPGYRGINCQEVDCLSPDCSGNGLCTAGGQCRCFSGYWGSDCSLQLSLSNMTLCVRDCSWHGIFDFQSQSCICEAGWNGTDCEIEMCNVDCIHGKCEKQRCTCEPGWSGPTCDHLECDKRCSVYGFCNNGTCICKTGWNGKHCSLDGCPNSCNNNGKCQLFSNSWKCSCRDGWKGFSCEVAMEVICDSNMDEDRDGLIDCLDPDCCLSMSCKDSPQCLTVPDPMDILLRKQPPSNSAPFYDRMRFLIEDDSVQSFATLSTFNQSQVSVIRGKVIASDGSPMIGVRVSVVTQPLYGFTLTRDLGLFDILVNGGGSVTLNFLRQPFKAMQMTVMVPWNQMVTMDTVTLRLESEDEPVEVLCPRANHDPYTMRPVVLSTWKHTQLAACPSQSTIIPESQVLQESLQVPGTSIYLVYHSSRTAGYMSTIMIQLTPSVIPSNLAVVYLRILVEGIVHERIFEADPNLKYKFAWDRRNAYNQKVFGIVTANVGVGYQYEGCKRIFWEVQSTTMNSYDISEIGGWNLHVHHTYNFQEGILHKGDGTNIYLKERPWKAVTILGNGKQRSVDCRDCDGRADKALLMAPVALASGRDGSLYVGDYNYIRKVASNREDVTSILQLSMPEVPYKYYMTVSPVDAKLYISDHQSLKIMRVKTMGAVRQLAHNYEVIAGTGEQCVPGEAEKCGDGGLAISSKLNYPKGIAINKDGLIFFADGANIRTINDDGVIKTVIGSQGQPKYWQPLPCHQVISIDEVTLHWPTSLAISPLDDTLHILDNFMVLKITPDRMVLVVAGRPLHCPPRKPNIGLLHDEEQIGLTLATDVLLEHPQHISFAPNGDLFIVESNGKDVNQVRMVDTDGKIRHYAGARPGCDCQLENCKCYKPKEELSTNMLLNNPTAVTITPDNILHIADMGNLRIHSVFPPLPVQDRQSQFELLHPQTQEMYIFNRHGQHVSTKNIVTGQYVYNFTYNVNSYYAKLQKITDAGGNTLVLKRDYKKLKELLPPGGQKCKFTLDSMEQLQVFTDSDNSTTKFTYGGNTGLLESKETSRGQTFMYDFDVNGRLTKVIQPTGELTNVDTDAATLGNYHQMDVLYPHDSYLAIEYPFKMAVTLETNPHPLLSTQLPLTMKRKIIMSDNLTQLVEWRYYSSENGIGEPRLRREIGRRPTALPIRADAKLRHSDTLSTSASAEGPAFWGYEGKELRVNGYNVLTFKYDRDERSQTILNRNREEVLVIKYDISGRPVQVIPRGPVEGLNVTYDRQGRMTQWNSGELSIVRIFENKTAGHLIERRLANKASYRYMYKNSNKPTDVILPSGKQYQLHYDDHGNLKTIVMPSQSKHHFYSLTTIGFHRIMYRSPDSRGLYMQDYNSAGQLTHIGYPSGHRRIFFYYNRNGQPRRMFFDWTSVGYGFYGDTKILRSVTINSNNSELNYFCGLIYEPHSTLATSHSVVFNNSKIGFIAAKFLYSYDRNFRINLTQASLGDKVFKPVEYSYSIDTGRLDKMFPFTFEYPHIQREITRDGNMEVVRDFDRFGRQTDVWYKFNNYIVFTMEVKYDPVGRMHQWRRKVRTSDLKTYEYVYDVDGNVVEVLENSHSTWKYETDLNGNIVKMSYYGNSRNVVIGQRDQVESSGQESYIYDSDGFVVQRDKEMFEYNSLGQLYRAFQAEKYDVRYYYDGHGRLTSRSDVIRGGLVQVFYANLKHKSRITHFYDHTTKKASQFFYDDRGKLLLMQRDSDLFYIGLDGNDSPILIMNSVGSIVKQVSYDPLGAQFSDSAPEFSFMLGFRCGFFDPVTKLVFFDDLVYDPQLGRRMSAGYERFLSRINDFPLHPESANIYRHDFLSQPISESESDMTDFTNWLTKMGYNFKGLIPALSFHGEFLTKPDDDAADRAHLIPVTSAFHCAFKRDMEHFLQMSTVPTSFVTGVVKDLDIGGSFAPFRYLFGPGIVVSLAVGGRVSVNVLDSAREELVLLASVLLNNSIAVGLQFTVHGRDIHHFIKPSIEQAQEDIKALSLRPEGTVQGLNVTYHRIPPDNVRYIDIRLHSNYTLVNLRYGTTLEAERDRILHHAKQRAIDGAWEIEREIVQSRRLRMNVWTKQQEEELVSKGKVEGMTGEYVLDVDEFVELADSPKNIRFVSAARR